MNNPAYACKRCRWGPPSAHQTHPWYRVAADATPRIWPGAPSVPAWCSRADTSIQMHTKNLETDKCCKVVLDVVDFWCNSYLIMVRRIVKSSICVNIQRCSRQKIIL